MMYIFLDIDGVLTTPKQWNQRRSSEELMPYPFDKDCVESMNEIIAMATYDTQFILSSDWRNYYDKDTMNKIFHFSGMPKIISDMCRSSLGYIERGQLISEYIKKHTNIDDTCIIIDDIPLLTVVLSGRKGCIFTTNDEVGLADKDVTRAILIYMNDYYLSQNEYIRTDRV